MRARLLVCLAVASAVLAGPATAQVKCAEGLPAVDRDAESPMSARDFVRAVAAKEIAFNRAFAGFGYTIDATVQTLQGDAVDGEYRHVSTVSVDAGGSHRAVAQASNTLQRIRFADRDLETLREAFTLTPERIAAGDIVYSGRQRVGDHNASLFDILPRDSAADVRGFQGRSWVRAREEAVMRLCGRSSSAPIAPMRTEVVRQQVAEQYWFPVLIRADGDAMVGKQTVHVRLTVKYSNYKAR